jgi:hypothetical protein
MFAKMKNRIPDLIRKIELASKKIIHIIINDIICVLLLSFE